MARKTNRTQGDFFAVRREVSAQKVAKDFEDSVGSGIGGIVDDAHQTQSAGAVNGRVRAI